MNENYIPTDRQADPYIKFFVLFWGNLYACRVTFIYTGYYRLFIGF